MEPRTGEGLDAGQPGPQDQPLPGGSDSGSFPILISTALVLTQDWTHPLARGDPPRRPRRGSVRGSSKVLWPLWQGPRRRPSEIRSPRLVGAGGHTPGSPDALRHKGLAAPPAARPLTLDLLMHHQREVVLLQDVRELAQGVRQADLEEKT